MQENVEIYPREGTETPKSIAALILDNTLKFIPVRGRKLDLFRRFHRSSSLKFIPVRGRKHALDATRLLFHR